MGEVIKFRAKLTDYDIRVAQSFGIPLQRYAERLAAVRIRTRQYERKREERKLKCAVNKSPSAAGGQE